MAPIVAAFLGCAAGGNPMPRIRAVFGWSRGRRHRIGRLVAEQLLAQIRNLISAGHEPNAGCGLNGWTHSA